jgi:hypothetical protein
MIVASSRGVTPPPKRVHGGHGRRDRRAAPRPTRRAPPRRRPSCGTAPAGPVARTHPPPGGHPRRVAPVTRHRHNSQAGRPRGGQNSYPIEYRHFAVGSRKTSTTADRTTGSQRTDLAIADERAHRLQVPARSSGNVPRHHHSLAQELPAFDPSPASLNATSKSGAAMIQKPPNASRLQQTYVTCVRAWPSRTAGDPWCGRSGSLAPSGWTASRPARVLCPGRWRGRAACPGRRPRDR